MAATGLRERKKAEQRRHISDVATRLFVARGFDAVAVTEIAQEADVSRPTVFAYFPRKEDLVFDRAARVTEVIVGTARTSDGPPVRAVCDLLIGPGPLGGFGATVSQSLPFWRLVAGSRVLLARARELADEIEFALAQAFSDRGVEQPELIAALVTAAYRTVHLHAIRRVLAGDSPDQVDSDRTAGLAVALGAVADLSRRFVDPMDA